MIKINKDLVWRPMASAPKDGTEILMSYDKDCNIVNYAFWSDRPVCMLGPVNGGFPPGWATGVSDECDHNLPLDEGILWADPT